MRGKMIIISLATIIILCLIGFGIFCTIWASPLKYSLIHFGPKSEKKIMEKEYTLEEVEELNISQIAGDVQIKEAENENIKIILYGENEEDYKIENNDKKVNVESNINNNEELFNFNVKNDDIIIFIPTSFSNDVNIDVKYGRCIISNLPEANVSINCDAGNTDIGNVKDITIHCECGNVDIDNIFNFCDINVKLGNIKIKKINLNEESIISADFGNIDIDSRNDLNIETKVNIGNVNIENKEVIKENNTVESKKEEKKAEKKADEPIVPSEEKVENQQIENQDDQSVEAQEEQAEEQIVEEQEEQPAETQEEQSEEQIVEEQDEQPAEVQGEQSNNQPTESQVEKKSEQNTKNAQSEKAESDNQENEKVDLFIKCSFGNITIK